MHVHGFKYEWCFFAYCMHFNYNGLLYFYTQAQAQTHTHTHTHTGAHTHTHTHTQRVASSKTCFCARIRTILTGFWYKRYNNGRSFPYMLATQAAARVQGFTWCNTVTRMEVITQSQFTVVPYVVFDDLWVHLQRCQSNTSAMDFLAMLFSTPVLVGLLVLLCLAYLYYRWVGRGVTGGVCGKTCSAAAHPSVLVQQNAILMRNQAWKLLPCGAAAKGFGLPRQL